MSNNKRSNTPERLSVNQKEEAKRLFNNMHSGFDDKKINQAFLLHREKAKYTPAEWKKQRRESGEEIKGAMGVSSYNKYMNKLRYISNLEPGHLFSDTEDWFKTDNLSSFKALLAGADRSIKATEKYIASGVREEFEREYLKGTKWAAYFSFYNFEGTKKTNEGIIGRAIVNITDISGKDGAVEFENTQLDGILDYKGKYVSHMDMHRGYICFDLFTDSRTPRKGRNIHIKVYCQNRDQELMIGQYTTYERGRIQSGRILLHNLNFPKKIIDVQAGAYSHYLKGCKDFSEGKINKTFLKFLSVRADNYHNDVFGDGMDYDITTVNQLADELLNKRQHDSSRFERFIERVKPKVFLAAANSNKEIISLLSHFKDQLDRKFDHKLYISFKDGKLDDEDNSFGKERDEYGFLQPFRNIEKLKRTRFFVLFLDKVDRLSYAHLQLGMALTVSKNIVVVGKKSLMSKTILDMRDSVIQKIIVDDLKKDFDFSKDYPLVLEKLADILREDLPTELHGDFNVNKNKKNQKKA